jgi:hypothetical protein
MTDTTDTKNDGRLAELVNSSFPNLRCLRCGNDRFYVTDDPAAASLKEARHLLGIATVPENALGAVVTLACRRCGHIEQHLTDLLQQAQKPVPKD